MKLQQLQEAKLALRTKQLSDFHVGDIILIVYRRHRSIEKRIAEIRSVNHKGHGGHHENGITFKDAYHDDYLSSGQGWFDPSKLGEHEYGMVDVEMFKRSGGAIREATYAGEHPIAKQIKAAVASGEYDFYVDIKDKKKAEDAERGIIAAFGPPDEQGPATTDTYRNMLWNLSNEISLQIIDGLSIYNKKWTRMNIALI